MKIFRCRYIRDAHENILNSMIWSHSVVGDTWESEPTCVEIINPLSKMIHPSSSFQQQRCDEYAKQIIDGPEPGTGFSYTYHERLFFQDQYDDIVKRLKEDTETRRAVMYTWLPRVDNKSDEVPCLQFIQLILRDGKLDYLVLFRSEDILSAFGPNAYGISRLVETIANELCVPVGKYTHIISVPHLYPKRDFEDLKRWM